MMIYINPVMSKIFETLKVPHIDPQIHVFFSVATIKKDGII